MRSKCRFHVASWGEESHVPSPRLQVVSCLSCFSWLTPPSVPVGRSRKTVTRNVQCLDSTPSALGSVRHIVGFDATAPLAYTSGMILIETPLFTKEIDRLLDEEAYRELQMVLVKRPDAGTLIPGSGGLRKIRWASAGAGKRGGARIIYYWHVPDAIFLLYPFKKNEAEDLTKDQLKKLGKLVMEWLK